MTIIPKQWKEKLKWLDPFTYVDEFLMPKVNPKKNKLIEWTVYIISSLVFAFLLFSILGFILGTNNPLVIVVSSSMEPVLHRGDIVMLQGTSLEDIQTETFTLDTPLEGKSLQDFASINYAKKEITIGEETLPLTTQGDILVYYSDIDNIQIIHRAVAKINAPDGTFILTKGDNPVTNQKIDQDCGAISFENTNQMLRNAPKQWTQVGNQQCACTYNPKSDDELNAACLVCAEQRCINVHPLQANSIDGKAGFRVPFLGCIKLWVFDDIPSLLFTGKLPSHFKGAC